MEKSNILYSTLWPAFTVVTFKLFKYIVTIENACDTSQGHSPLVTSVYQIFFFLFLNQNICCGRVQ